MSGIAIFAFCGMLIFVVLIVVQLRGHRRLLEAARQGYPDVFRRHGLPAPNVTGRGAFEAVRAQVRDHWIRVDPSNVQVMVALNLRSACRFGYRRVSAGDRAIDRALVSGGDDFPKNPAPGYESFSSGDESFDAFTVERFRCEGCERTTASDPDFAIVVKFSRDFADDLRSLDVTSAYVTAVLIGTNVKESAASQRLVSPDAYDRLLPAILELAEALDRLSASEDLEMNFEDDDDEPFSDYD